MKIGDKVRFLNDVGGGTVTGFQGHDTVLVQDEDGFDFPMDIRQCVVIETDDYNIDLQKKLHFGKQPTEVLSAPTSIKAGLSHVEPDSAETEREPVVTFRPAPYERRGADVLNVYLCFMPVTVTELSHTDFDTYLVNDSNYFLDFTYLSGEGKAWQLRHRGTAEPNTKVLMENVAREDLNNLQHLCLQFVAYKEDRPFLLKPPVTVELKPDLTKFYKLHTFASNDFFEERVLTLDVVNGDRPARHVYTNADDLREALLTPTQKDAEQKPHIHAIAKKKEGRSDIDVVDLHASELLDTTRGMSPADILEYQLDIFRRKMDECKLQKGKKLVFIHGKGQGVLRKALLRELAHTYKTCTSQDASFREYGYGATMVTIH